MDTARWIAIALLAPFWWGLALLVLAVLGDLYPGWRRRVSRLFDRIEGRGAPATEVTRIHATVFDVTA